MASPAFLGAPRPRHSEPSPPADRRAEPHGWQKASDYRRRAKVRALPAMETSDRQRPTFTYGQTSRTEVEVAVYALNRLLGFGRPSYERMRLNPQTGVGCLCAAALIPATSAIYSQDLRERLSSRADDEGIDG